MKKVILRLLFILTPIGSLGETHTEHSLGIAKDNKGNIVYQEKHVSEFRSQKLFQLKTDYFDPGGQEIGFIKTNFSPSGYVPSYEFRDFRSQRSVSVKPVAAHIDVTTKSSKDKKDQSMKFKMLPQMVAGQGLHQFLIDHLGSFIESAQHTETVKFFIPLNKDYYDFQIKVLNQTEQTITLRIEADNWFFRMVAPHIDVTYDKQKARLLTYKGPSNLIDKSGKKINVTIQYSYPEPHSKQKVSLKGDFS